MSLPYVGSKVLTPDHSHLEDRRASMRTGSDHEDWKTQLPGNRSITPPPPPQSPPYRTTEDEIIPNFTATGRPFAPGKAKNGSAMDALNASDIFCSSASNLLPRRYHDSSLITIAVLPFSAALANDRAASRSAHASRVAASNSPTSPTVSAYSTYSGDTACDNPIQVDNSSGLKFWRRKSSVSNSHQHLLADTTSLRKKSKGKALKEKAGVDFVMKNVPRGEYLKHYAKDDEGRYIGSEDPANDCILRNESDILKWRTPATEFKNEIS